MITNSYIILGDRKHQEDRLMIRNYSNLKMYVIVDGHGGSECSSYLERKFCKAYYNRVGKIKEFAEFAKVTEDFFEELDTKILNYREITSGACLSVVLYYTDEDIARVVHLGDCGTIVVDRNDENFRTSDHRVDNETENFRLIKSGATINNNRYKVLSVSRTLGDRDCKNLTIPRKKDPLLCIPEISEIANPKYILIASDGLHDLCELKELYTLIRTKNSAKEILKSALRKIIYENYIDRVLDNPNKRIPYRYKIDKDTDIDNISIIYVKL